MGYYGMDTFAPLTSIATSQIRAWGYPSFFVRYGENYNMSDPNGELWWAWEWGARWLGLVWPSYTIQSSGDYSVGFNHGYNFASNTLWFYQQVAPLVLSYLHTMFLYLDQEPYQTTTPGYWQGYYDAIRGFEWPDGSYPLYPTLYCDPWNPQPNCSLYPAPIAIWSSEPVQCGWCVPFGSEPRGGWPHQCSSGTPPVIMWQYMIDSGCQYCNNYYTPVDADYSYTYNSVWFGEAVDNMFYLQYQP
jgi:hypothetical protein